jgi:hypothetical protein
MNGMMDNRILGYRGDGMDGVLDGMYRSKKAQYPAKLPGTAPVNNFNKLQIRY